MKLNHWLLSAAIALGPLAAAAQTATNAAPPAPTAPLPAVTTPNKPAPAAKPKRAKHKKNKSEVFNPPASGVVKEGALNIRSKPSVTGEVLGLLKQGDTVAVYEEITISSPYQGEPVRWDRIAMPTNTLLWVNAQYVDATNHVVRVKRLNARVGPGENYTIAARLEQGTPIDVVRQTNRWIAIAPPTNAFAFVAAEYLTVTAPPQAPEPEIEPAPAPPPPAPVAAAAPPPEPQSAPPVAAAPAPEPAAPPGPRIVTREGQVSRAYNIQAPTDYELRTTSGDLIEFLLPDDKAHFMKYVGLKVNVTGVESLDPRWPRTPIIAVQSINPAP